MRRPFVVLAVAAALLTACGSDGTATAGPATAVGDEPTGTGPATTAPVALQFEAPAVGGGSIDFSEFAGTTVALWFWAPT